MKDKQKTILVWVLVISLAIVALNQFGVLNLFAVTPTPGSQFIPNPSNPSSEFSLFDSDGRYTCDVDECIVSGQMIIANPTTTNTLQCSACTYNNGNTIATNLVNTGTYEYKEECAPAIDRASGCGTSVKCWRACKGAITTEYKATFNFCPSTDPNFPYCTGGKNTVYANSPTELKITEEVKLTKGIEVTFFPKYPDLTTILDSLIRVKKYDNSCVPAVADGRACSSNQLYCKPQLNACPSGYTFYPNSNYCGSSSDQNLRYGDRTNVCRTSSSSQVCRNPISGYNNYQKCDGTQLINQATCGNFTQTTYPCPIGQQCYLSATNQLGEGIGGCKCSASQCIIGEKTGVDGATTYQECSSVGTCTGMVDKTCPSDINGQLVYSSTLKRCVFPSANSCDPNQAICSGSSIFKCKGVTIAGESGYLMSQTAESCLGEQKCLDGQGDYDYCSCTNVDECTIGQIQCTSTSTYNECSKSSDINSCLKYRIPKQVGQLQECVNNQIRDIPDVGCVINPCSTILDRNNIKIEQCLSNACASPQDDFTATEQDYNNGNTRCYSGYIQKVIKYNGNSVVSYRWETKTDAQNSVNGLCTNDFACVQLLSTTAQCGLKAEFVGILTKESYGIDEKINDVLITLTDKIPNRANMLLTASLYEGTTEVKRISNAYTDSKGMVSLDFEYAFPRKTSARIEVTADPNGQRYTGSKDIVIASTLDLRISCPVQGFVGKEVTCSFSYIDLDCKAKTPGSSCVVPVDTVDISLTQGSNIIESYTFVNNKLTFSSDVSGGVNIKATAEKTGYIKDTAEILVSIEPITQTSVFEIDNKDYFSYSGSGITTGTHQLVVKTEDSSGTPEKVFAIQATVRTPSGQVVPLTFTKVSDGNYRTNYNFQQAGTTYQVDGTVQFEDVGKEDLAFSYTIVTLGSQTSEEKTNTILLITLIGGGVIVLIVIMVILLRKRR